ncbi:hypothetical protein DAPPUDRAFT_259826 [Daphnia pulex]|uniref:Uncharacterized protein n=1 Tax=Daphnia pulex TaxID=6669 RepID=E9HHY5_DAPPU|nr:hypothetical protein DAPPUDRAFT_259826 [Daphnia pulex]|eukprot:EFX68631.1 hypothetical protein DAPPUDRAFT_259826 [Daphnia pulex]
MDQSSDICSRWKSLDFAFKSVDFVNNLEKTYDMMELEPIEVVPEAPRVEEDELNYIIVKIRLITDQGMLSENHNPVYAQMDINDPLAAPMVVEPDHPESTPTIIVVVIDDP